MECLGNRKWAGLVSVRNAFTNSHPCQEILILRIEDEGGVLSNLVIELADKQMGRVLSVRENGIQSYQVILKESNKELRYSFTHFYFDEGFAFASKNYLATSLRTALLERLIQSVHNRQQGGDWIIEQLWRELFQDGREVVSPVEQTLLNFSSTVKLWQF